MGRVPEPQSGQSAPVHQRSGWPIIMNRRCYLPLNPFCGRHLPSVKLRRSNIDGTAGARQEIARIVARIRSRWPGGRNLWLTRNHFVG
jgi:hypothetical protein